MNDNLEIGKLYVLYHLINPNKVMRFNQPIRIWSAIGHRVASYQIGEYRSADGAVLLLETVEVDEDTVYDVSGYIAHQILTPDGICGWIVLHEAETFGFEPATKELVEMVCDLHK